MAELNPPLGTTTPEIFLDNVKRADELVNGPAGTVNDRAGEPLDTWRQMMAKNDEVRQNLIRSISNTRRWQLRRRISRIFRWARPRITAARITVRSQSR
ncbi:flagellar biosynthesis, cell-distal portion of basal-body rod [Klebsiella pneumoniae]|nr:flagellar biosynthesis, cell-distal portion of basal-body rod [Klebsiella pneumoniae]